MSQDETSSSRGFSDTVRWLWHESLVRRLVIEKDGNRPVVLPLLVVIIAGILAPWLVAIGVVVAVLMGYVLHLEREADETEPGATAAAGEEPGANAGNPGSSGAKPSGEGDEPPDDT